jgi:hypothetical protein
LGAVVYVLAEGRESVFPSGGLPAVDGLRLLDRASFEGSFSAAFPGDHRAFELLGFSVNLPVVV